MLNNSAPIQSGPIIVSLPAGGAGFESTPGDVRAYDVRTGEHKWTFHSVPRAGEFGADTWPAETLPTGGGVHNWSEMTVDEDRGIVFIPFGTARYDFYGGNRKGDNLFANSLVALDANTGKRLWHFQTVHHDLWDYDLPTAPKLLTVRNSGRNVDIVAQPSKHGFLFVFNRENGQPLWPIEERPVPQSDVPGEYTSPTQPFPTVVKPFARQSFTEKDINPLLPEAEQETVRQRLRESRNEGLFTPPSVKGTIQLPGHNGGANWNSSAVDPTKGTMYIVSKELPTYLKVNPPAPGGGGGRGGGGGGGRGGRGGGRGAAAPAGAAPAATNATPPAPQPVAAPPPPAPAGPPTPLPGENFVRYNVPYDFMARGWTTRNIPPLSPPWSQLTAYDLNTGETLWQVPHGGVSALGEAGKNTGSVSPRGGVVVTAGGLVFAATPSDRKLRAYDQDNGKVLWEYTVPAASEGIPAVYEVGGRQFIAFPVGGAGNFQPQAPAGTFPPNAPGQYMVFALPRR